jgi:hypothetical protein
MAPSTSRNPSPSSSSSTPSDPSLEKPEPPHARREPEDVLNLPYRTLSATADLDEYTRETPAGEILHTAISRATGQTERFELVTWTTDDPENPKNWSRGFKWWCTMTVAVTCFTVAFNSAVITADVVGPAREFGVSEEVGLLAISLFVVGFGVGMCALCHRPLFPGFCGFCWRAGSADLNG